MSTTQPVSLITSFAWIGDEKAIEKVLTQKKMKLDVIHWKYSSNPLCHVKIFHIESFEHGRISFAIQLLHTFQTR